MSEFSIKKIFDKSAVNALLDNMYYQISKALPEVAINDVLCLTGRAAAEMQGAAGTPCENIIFITNSVPVYQFAQDKLHKLLAGKGSLKFKERTVFYFDGLVLEVWYQPAPIAIRLFGGAYVQLLSEINPILL